MPKARIIRSRTNQPSTKKRKSAEGSSEPAKIGLEKKHRHTQSILTTNSSATGIRWGHRRVQGTQKFIPEVQNRAEPLVEDVTRGKKQLEMSLESVENRLRGIKMIRKRIKRILGYIKRILGYVKWILKYAKMIQRYLKRILWYIYVIQRSLMLRLGCVKIRQKSVKCLLHGVKMRRKWVTERQIAVTAVQELAELRQKAVESRRLRHDRLHMQESRRSRIDRHVIAVGPGLCPVPVIAGRSH